MEALVAEEMDSFELILDDASWVGAEFMECKFADGAEGSVWMLVVRVAAQGGE